MISIELNEHDVKKIIALENRLVQSKASIRRKVLHGVAKKVIKHSQARTRAQSDLEGQSFEPHKQGRRRKMLVRLARRLTVVESSDEKAVVGFKSPVEGQIGAKHQFGFSETFHKSQFKNKEKKPLNSTDPATRRQAKALREVGYKYKPQGKSYRTPTLKWITQNLTVGRAGLILRLLRGSREFWTTVLPPRSFLGATDAEINEMIKLAISETESTLNAAMTTS